MTLRLLVDMNLSPGWVQVLRDKDGQLNIGQSLATHKQAIRSF